MSACWWLLRSSLDYSRKDFKWDSCFHWRLYFELLGTSRETTNICTVYTTLCERDGGNTRIKISLSAQEFTTNEWITPLRKCKIPSCKMYYSTIPLLCLFSLTRSLSGFLFSLLFWCRRVGNWPTWTSLSLCTRSWMLAHSAHTRATWLTSGHPCKPIYAHVS